MNTCYGYHSLKTACQNIKYYRSYFKTNPVIYPVPCRNLCVLYTSQGQYSPVGPLVYIDVHSRNITSTETCTFYFKISS